MSLFSLSFSQMLLDGAAHPKFVNPLPNALDPSFIFTPVPSSEWPDNVPPQVETYYEIGMYQFEQSLGLVDPLGNPLLTKLYGYGNAYSNVQGPTFPGRTFVVQGDPEKINNEYVGIQWRNYLPIDIDNGHLLPVDETLHWAFSLPGYDSYTLRNNGVPVVPHVHGGHTESESDGLPEYWWTPDEAVTGPRFVKSLYEYENDQQAGTIWYHDHGLGITRLNVYAGLAGFFIIRDQFDTGDAGNTYGLPIFPYEVPIVIQDRMFKADGQLYYPATDPALPPGAPNPSALPEFFGDFILVNGQAWPVLDVEPRVYRFRILDGSDSRFYNMWIAGGPQINVIGTDDALLPAPVALDKLTIGPGERYDVLVDFAGFEGQTLILRNNARSPFPKGATVNPNADGQIMAFRVGTIVTDNTNNTIPTTLTGPVTPLSPTLDPITDLPKTRKLLLFEGTDEFGRLQPMLGVVGPTKDINNNIVDGTLLWNEQSHMNGGTPGIDGYPITEFPMLDETEIWEVYNATMDAHPIHLHLVSFQILGRQKYSGTITPKSMIAHDGSNSLGGTLSNIKLKGQQKGPNPEEAGWKDTAIMYPGEVTRVIATFDRPGRYVWHCHILSHEDHEMMRPYEVVGPALAPGAPIAAANVSSEGFEVETVKPEKFALEANFPNPFNPSTEIRFQLPEASSVELKVFNTLGQEVITLVQGAYEAGVHSVVWNARDKYGNQVPSGLYIYRITAGNFVQERKMMLLK